MRQKPWNKSKRWFAWLGGGVIVLCLVAGGFWYWINIPPQIKIPTPVMPHPNGYDFFVRAGAAYVEDTKGVDEITDHNEPIPGKVNQYPLPAKEAWLKQNAKAFELLHEGLKYPALHPPVRSGNSTIKYGKFRDLARALVVESHVRVARGDWSGAANSMLDGLEFSYDIPRGGPLIAGLVGQSVSAICLCEMYQISPHLNAKAARQAAMRIEHLYAGRFPYFKTLQEEKWSHQAEILKIVSENTWRQNLINLISNPSPYAPIIALITHDPYSPPSRIETAKVFLKNSSLLFVSKRNFLNNYTKGMDAYIAHARVPYTKMKTISVFSDPFTSTLLSVYKDTRWNWARMNAYSVLDMTMLALRAFRIEKGHYPTTLKELVPEYLKANPIDPFTDAPLHYQLRGNKYILWSIGPDGIDNHGTPIINQSNKYAAGAKYRLMDPDSKGDVVADMNTP
ncbi:MAG: hypothetical protein ABI210_06325 [Abditibacteriaceae bacterium]